METVMRSEMWFADRRGGVNDSADSQVLTYCKVAEVNVNQPKVLRPLCAAERRGARTHSLSLSLRERKTPAVHYRRVTGLRWVGGEW
jgi:hypothetical protein